MRCACGKPKPVNQEQCIRCRTAGRAYEPVPNPTTCTECGFTAKSRAGLVAHVRAQHGEDQDDAE